MRRALLLAGVAVLVAGCGASPRLKAPTPRHRTRGIPRSLLAEVRPIGRGPRFQPPVRGQVTGVCMSRLGNRLQAHIELFGANRVVLLATGIGTRAPRRLADGRLSHARCFGAIVTLDPTGIVYFRPGERLTLGDLFRAWGQPLSDRRIASFTGGRVRVYVNGHPRAGAPAAVPLGNGAEIVLEIGARVPPHSHFSFPAWPAAGLS